MPEYSFLAFWYITRQFTDHENKKILKMPEVFIDISSTLRLEFTSGVQRVTRELLPRLAAISPQHLHFHTVAFCPRCRTWYRPESDLSTTNLRSHPSTPLLGRAAGTASRALLGEAGAAGLHRRVRRTLVRCQHENLSIIRDFPANSIFLDIDSAWHALLPRDRLLPDLSRRKVRIMSLHHDTIPLMFPQWVHPHTTRVFKRFLHAHLQYDERFICVSSSAEKDLLAYSQQYKRGLRPLTATIRLGVHPPTAVLNNTYHSLPEVNRFILSVGTLEPRKNQILLLEAFDEIQTRYPDVSLVIVGRQGWKAQSISKRIKSHPLWGQSVFWLDNAEDQVVSELYGRADLFVFPSYYEGFGLPVQEALAHGCVTLSSNAGALPEAGQEFVEYFNPNDKGDLIRLLDDYLGTPDKLRRRRQAIKGFKPPTWDNTAQQLINILEQPPVQ
ncbi:glycosyltransferase family 4 protein [Pseudomonadota bacterium]